MIGHDSTSATATDTEGPLATPTELEPMRRRRQVLDRLESLSGRATVDELVDELLSAGYGKDATAVRLRLVHVDLPWLVDANRIAHDVAVDRIRLLE